MKDVSTIGNSSIPPKIAGAPARYIQGADALDLLGGILKDFGEKPLILHEGVKPRRCHPGKLAHEVRHAHQARPLVVIRGQFVAQALVWHVETTDNGYENTR